MPAGCRSLCCGTSSLLTSDWLTQAFKTKFKMYFLRISSSLFYKSRLCTCYHLSTLRWASVLMNQLYPVCIVHSMCCKSLHVLGSVPGFIYPSYAFFLSPITLCSRSTCLQSCRVWIWKCKLPCLWPYLTPAAIIDNCYFSLNSTSQMSTYTAHP